MKVIVTKSAKKDYKSLPAEIKNKVKKIIKKIRKGELIPEKIN
jgi:mRNA-degrading endonuclease RelE of RelBE toxin-antitoxin system